MGQINVDYKVKDVDIRNYAKYILSEGNMFEKRDLMDSIKSKIILNTKEIVLQS